MSKQTEAQRLAEVLRAFDRSKQYQPSGSGGQMVGSEQYKLIAAGWTFAELHNAADELLRQEALIAELAGALTLMLRTHDEPPESLLQEAREQQWIEKARAALAKVKQ